MTNSALARNLPARQRERLVNWLGHTVGLNVWLLSRRRFRPLLPRFFLDLFHRFSQSQPAGLTVKLGQILSLRDTALRAR